MSCLGIEPSVRQYTALLAAFAVGSDFDGAERIFREVKELGLQLDSNLCA